LVIDCEPARGFRLGDCDEVRRGELATAVIEKAGSKPAAAKIDRPTNGFLV
jgi:hypothetical protein